MTGPVVAIDGPAGSGKSTLARRLALVLNLPYVNTGSMYRAVTLAALREGVDLDDGSGLAAIAARMNFDLDPGSSPPSISIDGSAPPPELRSDEVERHVSQVSAHGELRRALHGAQRRLGAHGAVMEGRDIGSVVFPQAALKLYLLAPSSTRARRRLIERAGGEGGVAAGPRSVAEALQARDRRDERVNPPVPPPGAVVIDTNDKDAEAVFREALALARRALEASR